VSGGLEQSLREINGKVGGLMGGEIDTGMLAILGLLGIAIVQLTRGNIMIPAISALWYAYSLMKERQVANNSNSHTGKTTPKEINDGRQRG
jgi:hypothetical protein